MTKKSKNSLDSKNKSRRGVNWTASWLATLAASVALSLGLTIGTATKENKNYKWDYPFSHNLKEMAEWSKKLDRWEPLPIFTWRILITHDGEPYEVKDSIKVFFDVDEHFTLNTHVINWKWYEELQKIMREVALKKDSSAIVWFDFVKKGVEPNLSSQETKIDAVKWYASPEAIKYEGSSLKIWNVESENIKTAEKRAEIWRDSLMVTLAKICADNPDLNIDISSISVSWDEIQLNEEELKTLEDLASFEWYSSVEQMIYANERWEIKNKSVSEVINKIINTKRHVVVTFTKKWNPDTIYVVPLVLLPILIFKRKKTGSEWWENWTEWWEWTEWWRTGWWTGTEWEWTEWGETEWWWTEWWGWTWGGWWGDGPWPRPWPLPKSKKQVMYKKPSNISNGKQWTEKPMTQRKQPRDKRPHNFSNERKWGFSRSRSWRTDK